MQPVIEEIKAVGLQELLNGQAVNIGSSTQRVNPCPICGHKDCFTIYQTTNQFKCYSCGNAGSNIDLVIKAQEYPADDFLSACKYIAQFAGIEFKTTAADEAKQQNIYHSSKIFKEAANFYYKRLWADENKHIVQYLTKTRGRTKKFLKERGYGYADGASLYKHLLSLKFSKEQILASGLCKQSKVNKGNIYDFLGQKQKPNIIYPVIFNNQVCDFKVKAPKLPGFDGTPYMLPKNYRLRNVEFLNQTALYNKTFILVEGQEDCYSLMQNGFDAVACFGSISKKQLQLIKKYAYSDNIEKVIYLGFDNDEKGRQYTQEIAEAIIGLCDLKYLDLGNYKDPDDYIKAKGKKGFTELYEEAPNYLSYRINQLNETNNSDPNAAARRYMPILKLIANIDDEVRQVAGIAALSLALGGKGQYTKALKNELAKLRGTKAVNDYTNTNDDDKKEEKYGTVARAKSDCYGKYKPIKDSDPYFDAFSNFVFDIISHYRIDDVKHYNIRLTNMQGVKSREIKLCGGDRVNSKRFRDIASEQGPFYFSGNDQDIAKVWQLEEKRAGAVPYNCAYNKLGYIKEENLWLFGNCAYKKGKLYAKNEDGLICIDGIGYISEDVNVYSGDIPTLNLTEQPTHEFVKEIASDFYSMLDDGNESFNAYMVLGYIGAMVYLQELTNFDRKFPYLMIYGPSGTGKTEVALLVQNILGFSNIGENWGEATSTGISQAMQQLSSLTYWLEEYKNPSGTNNKHLHKIQIVNNIYNRSSGGKGGLHNKRQSYEVNAALMLTGQDRPSDKAMLSRCFVVRKQTPSDNASMHFFKLRKKRRKLSLILRYLLENKTPEMGKSIIAEISKISDFIKNKLLSENKQNSIDERTLANLSIIAAGFKAFNLGNTTDFYNWLAGEAVKDVDRKGQEDILFKFFEFIETNYRNIAEIVKVENAATNPIIYFAFNHAFSAWEQYTSTIRTDEVLTKAALKDYLKNNEHNYWKELGPNARKTFADGNKTKQKRCIAFIYNNLPDDLKSICEPWVTTDSKGYDYAE